MNLHYLVIDQTRGEMHIWCVMVQRKSKFASATTRECSFFWWDAFSKERDLKREGSRTLFAIAK